MAALQIQWETATRLAKSDAVVTGDSADDSEEAPSAFAGIDKPCVVFVADPTAPMAEFEQIETVVFKNEKIGLAMKAFRAIRMAPSDADSDPILAENGKSVPRILVVDPVKEKVKTIEEKQIKVSTLYKHMKSVSGSFYKEKLDKLVKTHLKLLTEQDQLANEAKVLKDKETRLGEEDSAKAKKDLEKVREELAEVEKELQEIQTKARELWKLTPKNAAA